MTTLPPPTWSFTIPSIHDGTLLDCRVYHPAHQHAPLPLSLPQLPPPPPSSPAKQRNQGAVIAHPYAPLGGSYDDAIVAAMGRVFLGRGFVVGTFNFRGAGSSKGRTSFTSKAEVADYASFAGFFAFYLHYLETLRGGGEHHERLTLERITSAVPLTVDPSVAPLNTPQSPATSTSSPLLILGGYSYGSLITSHLPPTPSILALFTNPTPSTATYTSEILLRAHHCAIERNKEEAEACSASSSPTRGSGNHCRSGVHTQGVVMGGEEGEPSSRRASREVRRSIEVGRLSVEIPLPRLPLPKKRSTDIRRSYNPPSATPPPTPKTAYLLISPLLPPISHFLALPSPFQTPNQAPPNSNLTTHPTLAIYGTHDIFTSSRRLSNWAEDIKANSPSESDSAGFKSIAIAGAGHFWAEEGVEEGLRSGLAEWIDELVNPQQ